MLMIADQAQACPRQGLDEPRCPCGFTFEDCRGCPPKGTQPLLPACQTGDSDPDMDEALRRVRRLLLPVAQKMDDDSDDACPVCGNWTCTCGRQVAVVDVGSMAEESGPCGTCHGSGGYTETTYDADGTRRDTWHSCSACGGSGQA